MSQSSLSQYFSFTRHTDHHCPVHHQSTLPSLSAHTSHLWIFGCSTKASHLFLPPGSKYVWKQQQQFSSWVPTGAAAVAVTGVADDRWVMCPFLMCSSILPTSYSPIPCINISLLETGFYYPDQILTNTDSTYPH